MKVQLVLASLFIAAICVAAGPVIEIKCETNFNAVPVANKQIGASFLVKCPAGCSASTLYGSDVYTTDSSVCTAAVHAGVIKAGKGGVVKVLVLKSPPAYKGSNKNGVQSSDWASSWSDKAFRVSKP